jgi:hypothetical protein
MKFFLIHYLKNGGGCLLISHKFTHVFCVHFFLKISDCGVESSRIQLSTVNSINLNAYYVWVNPLNAELNPICRLLALLGAHHILHVSVLRVNDFCCVFCINRSDGSACSVPVIFQRPFCRHQNHS